MKKTNKNLSTFEKATIVMIILSITITLFIQNSNFGYQNDNRTFYYGIKIPVVNIFITLFECDGYPEVDKTYMANSVRGDGIVKRYSSYCGHIIFSQEALESFKQDF